MSVRIVRLIVGLLLYGFTMALMVQAGLGLDPWDVFHQGLTNHVPLTFGQVVILVGAIVLLLWVPLRQRPGVGTILNIVIIGLAADAGIALVPVPDAFWARSALMILGIFGNALAGALYVGAQLGPGPRDGLWVAIVDRTGISVRMVRTGIEITVLITGFLLGGTIGIGTVLYALAIGPLVQLFLGLLPQHEGGGRRQGGEDDPDRGPEGFPQDLSHADELGGRDEARHDQEPGRIPVTADVVVVPR
jgi:uncharacterized membrane protein YczE